MTANPTGGVPLHVPNASGPLSRSFGIILRESDMTADPEDYGVMYINGEVDIPAGALVGPVAVVCPTAWACTSVVIDADFSWSTGTDMLGAPVTGGAEGLTEYDATSGGAQGGGLLTSTPSFTSYGRTLNVWAIVTGAAAKADRAGVALIVGSYSVPEYVTYSSIVAD